MAVFKPFRAARPKPEFASKVAALPYDVMNSQEAREMVKGKPLSFLHVDRAEVDLPEDTDLYSQTVYETASKNLQKLMDDGVLIQDAKECFYIYRQIMNGRSQTGVVGCASIDDYLDDTIKKHEFTRADKELDRINHVDSCNANTGPIFLTYRPNDEISRICSEWKEHYKPVYDFIDEQGVTETVWVVDTLNAIKTLQKAFSSVKNFYIADGHHRSASGVKVGLKRRTENPKYTGNEAFNYFLAVAFSSDELEIMDYNRVLKGTNKVDDEELFDKIGKSFIVETAKTPPYKPEKAGHFGMLYKGTWYTLTVKPELVAMDDVVASLDVSLLQNLLLKPILGIDDPRTNDRIDFVGGIRGLGELEKRVQNDMVLAFSMYPTTIDQLLNVADAGLVMPPKSTWFEPKLLSGLFIHFLAD